MRFICISNIEDFEYTLSKITSRARYWERLGKTHIKVPFYRVEKVRRALDYKMPAQIEVTVSRLSFWDHLGLWHICKCYGSFVK